MGVEIAFYIQKHNLERNEWENIFLYKNDKTVADIWRCGGDYYEQVRDNFHMHLTEEDIVPIAKEAGWTRDEDEDEGYEDIPHYAATLTKVKTYFPDLAAEISYYLTFAEEDYLDSDNIRVVALVSY